MSARKIDFDSKQAQQILTRLRSCAVVIAWPDKIGVGESMEFFEGGERFGEAVVKSVSGFTVSESGVVIVDGVVVTQGFVDKLARELCFDDGEEWIVDMAFRGLLPLSGQLVRW